MKTKAKQEKSKRANLTPPVPCRVLDPNGKTYHPTKAPQGLSKCGVMLELMPRDIDYIFDSHHRARHAIAHTRRYLEGIGLPFTPEEYMVQDVVRPGNKPESS